MANGFLPVQPTQPQPQQQAVQAPSVGQAALPTENPTPSPEEQKLIEQEWLEIFKRPETQAALLQFGVNFAQPLQPGDTLLGQAARSVGAGAEAAGRVSAQATEAEQTEFERGIEERKVGATEGRVEATREATATGERVAAADRTSTEGIRTRANEALVAVANIRNAGAAAAAKTTAAGTTRAAGIRAKALDANTTRKIEADIELLQDQQVFEAAESDKDLSQKLFELFQAQREVAKDPVSDDQLISQVVSAFSRIKKGLAIANASFESGVSFTDEDIAAALNSNIPTKDVVVTLSALNVSPERIEAVANRLASEAAAVPAAGTTAAPAAPEPQDLTIGVELTGSTTEVLNSLEQSVALAEQFPSISPVELDFNQRFAAQLETAPSPEVLEAVKQFITNNPTKRAVLEKVIPAGIINQALAGGA